MIIEINENKVAPDNMLQYYVENALALLDRRPDCTAGEIAQREYAYFQLLEYSRRNLRIYDLMASNPEFYHRVLTDVFPGKDKTNTEIDDRTRSRARISYSLLSKFGGIPGLSSAGLDRGFLTTWIDKLKALGEESGIQMVTENSIGRVLAHAPSDSDGGWPDRAVRVQIERLTSSELEKGIRTERFNMRGVHGRQLYEGGDQERELAKFYSNSAARAVTYPRTYALLEAIAKDWLEYAKQADLEAAQRKLRS
jgi:hypothetical protein